MSATMSLKTAALGELDRELATTRRLLERLPEEHLSWKPHARSMSLGGLAWHIANLTHWQQAMVTDDGYDFAAAPPPRSTDPASAAEVLDHFDSGVATLRSLLDGADDEAMTREWTLRNGDQVMMRMPRVHALRAVGMNHLIHHRGQLSVYLRLREVPLPPMYGPTADER